MAEDKKEPEFTVTDRRRFTSEGEVAPDVPQEQAPPEAPRIIQPPSEPPKEAQQERVPPPPTAAERQAQSDAFDASKKQIDAQLEGHLGGRRAQDFEITFERFIASLYMSALMQLGLMQEQGGTPQVDLLGARQTVDTIALLAEKTKGNLSPAEENLMQNCLYELRMAYVEVTNALTRPPAPGAPEKK